MKSLAGAVIVLAIVSMASLVGAGSALAQVEQAHLRIDGMT